MQELLELSDADREAALSRFCMLQPHLEEDAPLRVLAAELGIRFRTAQRWVALYCAFGLAALVRKTRGDRGARRVVSDTIKTAIEGLALESHPLPITSVYRQIMDFAQRSARTHQEGLIGERGRPENVRSDNGTEFTSRRMLNWAEDWKVGLVHIQPARPMQNGHVESFHGRLRDECLNTNWFRTLNDVRCTLAAWREEYNCERPHSSLDYRAPVEFRLALRQPQTAIQLRNASCERLRKRGQVRSASDTLDR